MRGIGTAGQLEPARYHEQVAVDPDDMENPHLLLYRLEVLGIVAAILVAYVLLWVNRRRFSRLMRWAIILLGVVLAGCAVYMVAIALLIIVVERMP